MNLELFLHPVQEESRKVAVSKRFLDENGKPVEWELKAITSGQDEAIRKSCTKKIPVNGRSGHYTQETDFDKYLAAMTAACITYPNLNDKQLQDGYGVMGAAELLKVMLLPGEYAELLKQVQTLNGYDTTMNELVDEAKN